MKRDRREWFANPQDGTGMVYVFTESCGNGTGMEPVERKGTGLVFISIPVSLSSQQPASLLLPNNSIIDMQMRYANRLLTSSWLAEPHLPVTVSLVACTALLLFHSHHITSLTHCDRITLGSAKKVICHSI